jgi:AraC-like DNA-binding protein
VARARAVVEAAPDRDWSLAELSREAGVGPRHLERLFTRQVGVPLGEYLLDRRVRLAVARIRAGDGLALAALAAGFCDQSHLTRQFRRRLGASPGRWTG